MKRNNRMLRMFFLSATLLFNAYWIYAQTYPEPEFSNEPYYINKSAGNTLVRLEKNSSKMDTKTNAISGSESGYRSTATNLRSGLAAEIMFHSFFLPEPRAHHLPGHFAKSDSVMRANGVDPSMISGMNMSDPSQKLTLYKMESGKRRPRKLLLQKAPGMNPFRQP